MATKNLNTSPYYDDHSVSGNYHKILFKPSFAIQARELTQSQSILQEQVKRIATSNIQNGDSLVPGVLTYSNDVDYITIEPALSSSEIIGTGDSTKTNIVGTYVGNYNAVSSGSTIKAKIIAAETSSVSASDNLVNDGAVNSATDITLFLSYIRSDISSLSSKPSSSLAKLYSPYIAKLLFSSLSKPKKMFISSSLSLDSVKFLFIPK